MGTTHQNVAVKVIVSLVAILLVSLIMIHFPPSRIPIVVLSGVILIIILVNEKRKRNQKKREEEAEQEKNQKELSKKYQEEKVREEKEKQKRLEERMIEIGESDLVPEWWEVLHLSQEYRYRISTYSKFISKIYSLPIDEFIIVSRIKRQIVWKNNFDEVIILLDRLAKDTYKDEELEPIIKYLDDFLASLDDCKEFAGYEALINLIRKNGDVIFPLLNQKVPA